MNIFRRLPTRQLLAVLAGAVVVVGAVTAVAIAAIGGGPVPPPKPLDQAIQSAVNAPPVQGVTARIKLTNSLIDTSSVDGTGGNPLLRGADGRLWASNDGRLRLELFSSRGDTQLSIDGPAHTFTFYDGSSNSVYQGQLPTHAASKTGTDKGASADQPLALKSVDDALARLGKHADVSPANRTDIAGQPAYSVRITPKSSEGGMIGGLQLAWDAAHGIPLDVALYAKGSSSPVLELQATNISFGTVAASAFTIGIPPGAKVNKIDTTHGAGAGDKGTTAGAHHGAVNAGAQSLAAVRAALPFTLDAPPTLDNLTQSSVRQLTVNGKPAALLTYGQQLGTVVVLERAAGATTQAPGAGSGDGGGRLSLPTTSINGAKASVLPTAIGTLITFERNGISYTIAGSVSRDVAVAVARGL